MVRGRGTASRMDSDVALRYKQPIAWCSGREVLVIVFSAGRARFAFFSVMVLCMVMSLSPTHLSGAAGWHKKSAIAEAQKSASGTRISRPDALIFAPIEADRARLINA